MKFIHCADIHLDSKIEANLSPAKSKQVRREILQTFLKICDFATENSVTAVIIAGDLFDTKACSPVTKDAVLGAIKNNSGVDFLYLAGNHDMGKTLFDAEIPENLHSFGSSWSSFKYENVVISGAELNSVNCRSIYGGLCLDKNDINIVTMHGQVAGSMGDNLIDLDSLAAKHIDYLALGHIHSFKEGRLDKRGKWAYSGCPQGRGFDECGQKGFVMIETDECGLKTEFIPIESRQIYDIQCDITALSDFSEILKKIKQDVKDIDASSMVKVTLVGKVPAGAKKDLEYFSKELNDRFYFAKIKDKTRLEISREALVADVSLKGEFIRACLDSGLDGEQVDRIIECGLSALIGMEV